jgi:hypothetical protein
MATLLFGAAPVRAPPSDGHADCGPLDRLYSVHVKTRKLLTSERLLISASTRQPIFGFSRERSISKLRVRAIPCSPVRVEKQPEFLFRSARGLPAYGLSVLPHRVHCTLLLLPGQRYAEALRDLLYEPAVLPALALLCHRASHNLRRPARPPGISKTFKSAKILSDGHLGVSHRL